MSLKVVLSRNLAMVTPNPSRRQTKSYIVSELFFPFFFFLSNTVLPDFFRLPLFSLKYTNFHYAKLNE